MPLVQPDLAGRRQLAGAALPRVQPHQRAHQRALAAAAGPLHQDGTARWHLRFRNKIELDVVFVLVLTLAMTSSF